MRRLSAEPQHEPADLPAVVARLTDSSLDAAERRRALAGLLPALGVHARAAGGGLRAGGRWLSDVLLEVAPHIPVRDLTTLRAHHDGLSGDALAESLIRAASRTTAALGAAGGAVATASYAAPPTLLATPLRLAAETLAVMAVEVKLVAELHEVYDVRVTGNGTQRATAFVLAWMGKRGIDPLDAASLTSIVSVAARRQLRSRVMRTLGRQSSTIIPLFAGAVAGAELNRRETVSMGRAVRDDLRRR